MLAEALQHLGYEPERDFICQDDGDGPYIKEWLSDDPQPTEQEITAASAELTAQRLAMAYRDQRAVAYRDELGAEAGNFIKTIGDVLDVVLGQIEASDLERTPEMAAILEKRSEIKTRYPKAGE